MASQQDRVFAYSAPSGYNVPSSYSGSSGSQYSDRSAIPSESCSGGSTTTVVIASLLVLLILGFAVAALVIAMNGGDDAWEDNTTEDWQDEVVEDIEQNEANIDYLAGEVDALTKAVGGNKPAVPMSVVPQKSMATAVPVTSVSDFKKQLFDASGASASTDDVFDTTKDLYHQVRGKTWSNSKPESSGGWAPAARDVSRMVSPSASESIPYGKEEIPLEQQFPAAPLQGPGSGAHDGSEPSLTFKDVMENRQPFHTRGDLQPLVVQRNSVNRSAPASALDIAAEDRESAMRQFFANRSRGSDEGHGNLLHHELQMSLSQ